MRVPRTFAAYRKLKNGQKVRISIYNLVREGVIYYTPDNDIEVRFEGTASWGICSSYVWTDHDWIETLDGTHTDKPSLSKSINQSIMSISSFLNNSLRSEPEKTLIKAGILDENEKLTSEGRAILDHILYETHKDKLKEFADQYLAELAKIKK